MQGPATRVPMLENCIEPFTLLPPASFLLLNYTLWHAIIARLVETEFSDNWNLRGFVNKDDNIYDYVANPPNFRARHDRLVRP